MNGFFFHHWICFDAESFYLISFNEVHWGGTKTILTNEIIFWTGHSLRCYTCYPSKSSPTRLCHDLSESVVRECEKNENACLNSLINGGKRDLNVTLVFKNIKAKKWQIIQRRCFEHWSFTKKFHVESFLPFCENVYIKVILINKIHVPDTKLNSILKRYFWILKYSTYGLAVLFQYNLVPDSHGSVIFTINTYKI